MGMSKDYLNKVEKEEGIGGDRFKWKEGNNKIRILTMPLHTKSGKFQNHKFICWIIDRVDGKIKLAFLPYLVFSPITDFEDNEDYRFDGYPMPYDITVKATKAGTKEVEYTIIPSPHRTALTAEENEELAKKKPIEEIKAKLKEKDGEFVEDHEVRESPADAVARSNRNKAELNPMFIAFEKAINKAEDEEALDKTIGQIEGFSGSDSLNTFETDLLRDMVKNKKAKLTGVDSEDIKVEDIPF